MASPRNPKGAGRKRFFSNAVKREAFLEAVALGVSRADACKAVGCSPDTYQREIKSDPLFATEIESAIILGKIANLRDIKAAEDWRAKAWLLERQHYQEYGKRDPVAISPEVLATVISQLTGKLADVVSAKDRGNVLAVLQECLANLGGPADAS